jgi:hypothetical protein
VLRAALRPARPLLWVAVPALTILLVTLAVLARLADNDPAIRLQDDLVAAGFADVDVRLRVAEPADLQQALVDVRYRSGLGAAGRLQESEQLLRLVWERYDGRLGAVRARPDGEALPVVPAGELARRFGPRPPGLADASYPDDVSQVDTIVILALVAVFATFVLVACAALAAVLIVRRLPRPRPRAN